MQADEPRSIAELAEATGIPPSTVSREVARLREAGLLRTVRRGRLLLVEADRTLAYFEELRALLLKTVGPVAVLRDVLADVKGIDASFIFGSWARRHHGDAGPPPRDIDLLVIGDPPLDDLYRACRQAERMLRLDVTPVVRSPAEWRRPGTGFLAEVKRGPLVAVRVPE